MAIYQKMAPNDNESQGSSHDNSSSSDDGSSSCCECHEERHAGNMDMIVKSTRRGGRSKATTSHALPFLRASPATRDKHSRPNRRRSHANRIRNRHANSNVESTMMLMKRLHCQLNSLRSSLPPTARSSRPCSVIADALRYRKALEKEIELLLTALPYSQQVDVKRVECGGLQIGISCKKKSGLMVALMEAMESFGLHFSNVSVSCQDENIIIDALSTQENIGKADALKGMLVATITGFSRNFKC